MNIKSFRCLAEQLQVHILAVSGRMRGTLGIDSSLTTSFTDSNMINRVLSLPVIPGMMNSKGQ